MLRESNRPPTTENLVFAGHLEEARQAVAGLQQRDPTLRISPLRGALGPYRSEDLAKYEAGLRQAGLPG